MATKTSEVASFYDQHPGLEDARLKESPIEYAVTWAVIQQTIDKLISDTFRPLKILDLGGGTGVYAVQLAKQGHEVTLSDISSQELEVAKQHTVKHEVDLAQVITADARNIQDYPEIFRMDHYDLILCLGPFYHLLQGEERSKLLKDLIKMARPGGYIFAAFVTVFAHLRDVAKKDPGRLTREKEFYSEYLSTGQYTRTMPMHHTYAAEIRKLFQEVDDKLTTRRFVGTESFLAGQNGKRASRSVSNGVPAMGGGRFEVC